MSNEAHGPRLDRVEKEVSAIGSDVTGLKGDMTGLKADMRGFGSILNRIEQGVASAQERFDNRELASKPNMVAVMGVLITLISIIVGGAWLISGQLSTTATRLEDQAQSIERMIAMRDREMDRVHGRVDRVEGKISRGGDRELQESSR